MYSFVWNSSALSPRHFQTSACMSSGPGLPPFHSSYSSCLHMECGSSAVECRTRNQVRPGSNPPPPLPAYRFEDWAFSFSPLTPHLTQLYKRVQAIDRCGNVTYLVLACNCCMARMLLGEAELVSEWTGLPSRAKSVTRFERSNGLDTALYKNNLYLFPSLVLANPLHFLVLSLPVILPSLSLSLSLPLSLSLILIFLIHQSLVVFLPYSQYALLVCH